PEVDMQIWVEIGPRPIPRKYVITSKHVTGAPQYTLRIKEWNPNPQVAADAFTFKPPADAKRVEFVALADIDEIPAGQVIGAKKCPAPAPASLASPWQPPPHSWSSTRRTGLNSPTPAWSQRPTRASAGRSRP